VRLIGDVNVYVIWFFSINGSWNHQVCN